MFVRVKSTPNSPRKSVQIVESSRKKGKVSQKIVRYVGIAMDDSEEKKLKDLAIDIIAKLERNKQESSTQINMFDPASEEQIKASIRKKSGRPNVSLRL